jgi:hypothetical protein
MRNIFRLAACVLVALVCLDAKARDVFEGKWEITLTPESGGKEKKDTLTFKGETLTSEWLTKEGYKEAKADTDVRGGQIATFTATQEGKKGAKAKWTGTTAPGGIDGTLTVTDEKGESTTYNYKGTKKEK